MNCCSLLDQRDSLLIAGYSRRTLKKELLIVLRHLIKKKLIDHDNKIFKLIKPIKLYHQLFEGKNYRMTKCLTLRNWKNGIKFMFLNQSSLQWKIMIDFNIVRLKYNLIYQTSNSSTLPYISYNQQDCSCYPDTVSKFRYPRSGEIIKIRINIFKETSRCHHIMTIKMMDEGFIPLAEMSFKIRGKSVENNAFFLEWQNDRYNETGYDLPYQNGILLIETYPKAEKEKENKYPTNLQVQDFKNFTNDYIFKAHP